MDNSYISLNFWQTLQRAFQIWIQVVIGLAFFNLIWQIATVTIGYFSPDFIKDAHALSFPNSASYVIFAIALMVYLATLCANIFLVLLPYPAANQATQDQSLSWTQAFQSTYDQFLPSIGIFMISALWMLAVAIFACLTSGLIAGIIMVLKMFIFNTHHVAINFENVLEACKHDPFSIGLVCLVVLWYEIRLALSLSFSVPILFIENQDIVTCFEKSRWLMKDVYWEAFLKLIIGPLIIGIIIFGISTLIVSPLLPTWHIPEVLNQPKYTIPFIIPFSLLSLGWIPILQTVFYLDMKGREETEKIILT